MRKLLIIMMLCAFVPNIYGEEQKEDEVAEQAPLPMNETMTQFSKDLSQALTQELAIQNPQVVFFDSQGNIATVIKFDGRINLNQSRELIVQTTDIVRRLVEKNPKFQELFPNHQFDLNTANIMIDTYNDKLPKDKQGGISSVLLINGWLQFRGISQRTGAEILLHKEPFSHAQKNIEFKQSR